jgi:hypothetical protein
LKTLTLCENPRAQRAEHAVRMADGASCQTRRCAASYAMPRCRGGLPSAAPAEVF